MEEESHMPEAPGLSSPVGSISLERKEEYRDRRPTRRPKDKKDALTPAAEPTDPDEPQRSPRHASVGTRLNILT